MAQINVQTQIIDRDELARFLPDKSFRLIKFFENLAKDVSKTIPDSLGTAVEGPASSADSNVAIFDGTTGKKIQDSGVPINSLAPLNSPAFTGVPTAPTAAPGTSSTQIATTQFVDTELVDLVSGPGSATNNSIALFDGVTGKLIKDSAVLVTSLAPLASPVFTGNPTAPTPAPTDDDTSIATTAFVQAAVQSATAASFSANNAGVNQSIPSGALTTVTFSTESYDVGGLFASNAWPPPAGRLVMLQGNVVLTLTGAGVMLLAIFKNGVEFKRGGQVNFTGFAAADEGLNVTAFDMPNGTDVYTLRVAQTTGSAMNTNGLAALTYFHGTTIQT